MKYQRVKIVEGADGVNDGDISSANPLPVDVLDSATRDLGKVDLVQADPLTATGSLTAVSQSVILDVQGYGAVAVQLSGTWVATVGFDGTVDGTNYTDLPVAPLGGGVPVVTATANGVWMVNCGGLDKIRAFSDAFTSGTVTVNLQANIASAKNLLDGLGTSTNPLRVDPTGTTAQPITDNAGSLTIDNAALAVTGGGVESGALRVTIANDSTGVVSIDDNASSLTIDGTVTANAGTGTFTVGGVVAHDVAVSGNPNLIAARANANEPAVVADGDATHLWADTFGRLVVVPGHPSPEPPVTANGSAAGVSVIAAPGASLSLYICKGSVHNSAAAEAIVSLRDGAAGTIRWTANLAADGGGSLFDFGVRGWKLTANTALVMDAASATQYCNVTEYYIAA